MSGDVLQIPHWMDQEKKISAQPSPSIGFIPDLQLYLLELSAAVYNYLICNMTDQKLIRIFYDLQTCIFLVYSRTKGLKEGLDTWKKEMQKHYYQLRCL